MTVIPNILKTPILKTFLPLVLLCLLAGAARTQQIDSIYFHLYTDSLKKGVHNYINVDGKRADGRWVPLTAREINFSASAGRFDGNSLVLDTNFKEEKVTVKAVLKSNPATWKEITIYIKKKESEERLPTKEEVLGTPRGRRNG
jgi:hypothetical protein